MGVLVGRERVAALCSSVLWPTGLLVLAFLAMAQAEAETGAAEGDDGAVPEPAPDGDAEGDAEEAEPINHFEKVNVFDGIGSSHLLAAVVGLLG
eukprot:COSAG02_NODE_33190_length_504_cov_0.634568_1_plen_93_part_10